MTKTEISNILLNSEFVKNKNNKFGDTTNTKILMVFNKYFTYGFWAIKYISGETWITGYELKHSSMNNIDFENLPENIGDDMNYMWYDEFIKKFGHIK